MEPDVERGLLNQVVYGLIFVRDLDDPKAAEQLADAIVDGRGFAAPSADLVAAIDSALAKRRIHPQVVALTPHDEDALRVLERLREAIGRGAWGFLAVASTEATRVRLLGGFRAVPAGYCGGPRT